MADEQEQPFAGVIVTLMDWDEKTQEAKPLIQFEARFADMQMLQDNTKTVAITAGTATASGMISAPLGVVMDLLAKVIQADIERSTSPIIMPGTPSFQ